jgi:hypothetical protein
MPEKQKSLRQQLLEEFEAAPPEHKQKPDFLYHRALAGCYLSQGLGSKDVEFELNPTRTRAVRQLLKQVEQEEFQATQ